MLKRALAVSVFTLLLVLPLARAAERGEDSLRRDMEFARSQVYPALVNISVVTRQYGGGRVLRTPAAGSGVIVSVAGHVVTNYHVAENASRIVCRLPTKEAIEADVVTHDPLTDLTVLKLRLKARRDRNVPLPYARIGDSDKVRTGDYVLAMGNPLTLSSSMTLGICGNPRRVFASFTGAEMQEMDLGGGQLTGIFTRWIQHDALILPGNSGGPLVNMNGEVIGINELGGSGVGFAIPSNLVKHVLNQALASGEVIRGWFGLTLYPVEKMGGDKGVLVSSVQPGGPAEKAGLVPGDVLLAVNGHPTDALYFEEIPPLYKTFADLTPGETVQVFYRRGAQTRETKLTVTRMERYLADEVELRSVGLTVRDITGPMALIRRYPSTDGVLVTGIRPGFPVAEAKPKLRSGDVIVALAGRPVVNVEGMKKVLDETGKKKGVLVRVRRGEQDLITVIDLKPKPKPPPGGELPKAWIGIKTQVLTSEVAKAMDLGKTRGFRITQVFPRTEAEKAGLSVGDIITALNGSPLRAYRLQDAEILKRRVENLVIGEEAELTLLRQGSETKVKVLLEETPGTTAEAETAEDKLLEYKVREITFNDRISRRLSMDRTGVLVTAVTPGGWASLAGLRVKDLIQRIQGRDVKDIAEFKKVVKALAREKPSRVSIFVVRGYRTAFVFAQPDYED